MRSQNSIWGRKKKEKNETSVNSLFFTCRVTDDLPGGAGARRRVPDASNAVGIARRGGWLLGHQFRSFRESFGGVGAPRSLPAPGSGAEGRGWRRLPQPILSSAAPGAQAPSPSVRRLPSPGSLRAAGTTTRRTRGGGRGLKHRSAPGRGRESEDAAGAAARREPRSPLQTRRAVTPAPKKPAATRLTSAP